MKKFDTLKKTLENAIADENKMFDLIKQAKAIASNEAVAQMKTLENNDIIALLQFAELQKALSNSKYNLLLDINYEKVKTDAITVQRYSLINTHNKRALHIYRKSNNTFDVSFASDKNTQEKMKFFEAINQEFTVKRKFKADKTTVKDTYLYSVAFDKMLDACKVALLMLESSLQDIEKMLTTE